MHAAGSLLAAVVLCAASAAAAAGRLAPRQTVDDAALQPWITVGDDGKPTTVTPVMSTASGTPTVISAAPDRLTATVVTSNLAGQIRTTTLARPAEPTATNSDGRGAFMPCHKKQGDENAPFCAPTPGMELNPGNTYYFIWDPTFFASPNTTIRLIGDYTNQTTGLVTTQAFESDVMRAAWGFWSWPADKALMPGGNPVNISVHMATLPVGGNTNDLVPGPRILLTYPPGPKPKEVPAPAGPALYIGLPVILGFALFCIFGTLLWNKHRRTIGLGNIMSRGRGGYGIGKNARARMGLGRNKKNAAAERLQLMEREMAADGHQVYRDVPEPGIARRDSDALGSLAGTPTRDRWMDFGHPFASEGHDGTAASERNHFRDESSRQAGGAL